MVVAEACEGVDDEDEDDDEEEDEDEDAAVIEVPAEGLSESAIERPACKSDWAWVERCTTCMASETMEIIALGYVRHCRCRRSSSSPPLAGEEEVGGGTSEVVASTRRTPTTCTVPPAQPRASR